MDGSEGGGGGGGGGDGGEGGEGVDGAKAGDGEIHLSAFKWAYCHHLKSWLIKIEHGGVR